MRALHSTVFQQRPCDGVPKLSGRKARQNGARGQGAQSRGAPLQRQVAAAARNNDAAGWDSWSDWRDTCMGQNQGRPSLPTDLDAEWQAFLTANGRLQQPKQLLWGGDDSDCGDLGPSCSSSSAADSDCSSTGCSGSDLGPAYNSNSLLAGSSHRYSSSIQSFDDWDSTDEDYAVTVPCQLPSSEALHGSASNTSLSLYGSSYEQLGWAAVGQLMPAGAADLCAPSDMTTTRSLLQSLREVYVLLFGVGQKDTEGIYSLRAVADDGLPMETIIAFENMEDAIRYSSLLEATMEHCPHVCSIPPTELMAFCSDNGYKCRLELEGSLLMPPDYNVHITDWERSLRLREGKFHVLPEEPDLTQQQSTKQLTAAAHALRAASNSSFRSQHGREFTESQLNTLKARLEALLPDSTLEGPLDGWAMD